MKLVHLVGRKRGEQQHGDEAREHLKHLSLTPFFGTNCFSPSPTACISPQIKYSWKPWILSSPYHLAAFLLLLLLLQLLLQHQREREAGIAAITPTCKFTLFI